MEYVYKLEKNKLAKIILIISMFAISLTTVIGYNISSIQPKNLIVYADDPVEEETKKGPWVEMTNDGYKTKNELETTGGADSWNKFIKKFQFFITGVSAIGTVAMVLFFIFNFLKLSATFDNDSARSKVIKGLVWSAIAAAGLGSVTIFVGFFLGALK